jgi:tRNA/rRNA methyltransferase
VLIKYYYDRKTSMTSFNPALILIRPQMGENIGAAARVCKNFGFADLRIVAPRDGWPNPKAESMAAGGADVLKNTRLFKSTSEAIENIQFLYATTARPRDMEKRCISAHDLVADLKDSNAKKIGILFGPERSGLENEDIALADSILSVPVNEAYPSLNLAQIVALMAYECSKLDGRSAPAGPAHRDDHNADKAEIQGLFDQLEGALDNRNFWKVANKKEKMWLNIRSLFAKAELTKQEVRTLRGMVRSLSER